MTEINDFHADTPGIWRRKISLPFQSIQIFLMMLISSSCRSVGWQTLSHAALWRRPGQSELWAAKNRIAKDQATASWRGQVKKTAGGNGPREGRGPAGHKTAPPGEGGAV